MKKLLLISVLLMPGWSAYSADNKEIKFKSRDLEKVKTEMNQKRIESERLEREAAEIKASLKDSQSKMKSVETTLIYTKQKDREIEQKLAVTKNEHDKLLASVADQKSQLQGSFRNYEVAMLMNQPSDPEVVFNRQILHAQGRQLYGALSQSEQSEADLRSLIDTHQTVRGEVKKQENKLSTLRAGQEDKEKLINKKKTRQEALEAEVHELQQTAEQLASLIDVLRSKAKEEVEAEKEARRIKQISGPAPIGMHTLPWPLQGKVTTKFGRQQNTTLGTTFVSNGLVISSEDKQDIFAVADGKVLYAGEFMSYGPMTVVEHPGDWYTVYGQMARWDVEKGQLVKKGEKMGSTRASSHGGYEAYFELRFYGKSTDPLPWLVRQE